MMDYTMDDFVDTQDGSMTNNISSQGDSTDYTMEHQDTMDYTMSHDAANQALSQLPDAEDFSEEGEEEEIPVVELARSIGVSRDHQLDNTSVEILLLMQEDIHQSFSSDLDDNYLSLLTTPEINTNERLSLSIGAARLLTSIAQNESQGSIDALPHQSLGPRDIRNLRIEIPILRTDHDFDVKGFARRDEFEVRPQDIRLPLELLSIENNEGLGFPSDFYDSETEAFETIVNEKIEVTRYSMTYLQTALKATLTIENEQEIWERERTHPRKFPVSFHVTPLLYPVLASVPDNHLPFVPSDCEIPVLSDPDSFISLDLRKIEDEVFEKDLPTPLRNQSTTEATTSPSIEQCVKPADLYSPLEYIRNFDLPSSPIEKRKAIENLKVEEILTPPKPLEESGPRSVHFNNIVEEFLLSSRPQSLFFEPVIETKFFEEAFGDNGEIAQHQVEQERLADTRNRVEVPVMDFSIPEPLWMITNFRSVNAVNLALTKFAKDISVSPSMRWPGLRKLHSKVPWVPFEHTLGNIVEDSMGNKKTWEVFVCSLDDEKVVTSSNLTWKREGFRILQDNTDGDDDDDELELGYFPKEPLKVPPLIGQQDFEAQDVNQRQKSGFQPTLNAYRDTMVPFKPLITPEMRREIANANSLPFTKRARSVVDEQTSLLGGIFSAKDELNNFMEIRGAKKPRLIESSHFLVPDLPAPLPSNQITLGKESQFQQPEPSRSPLPTPIINAPTAPISLILSSTILKNRPLLRSLEALIPTLKICERDFSAHNTTAWNPGSVIRSPVTSNLTHEADIIISPSTGLILTTLQHVKQKPLPGHKTAVPIRDRLEKVSARYENLVILVASPTTGIGDSDSIAWADFVGFTLTLPARIIVNYIPVDKTNSEDQSIAKFISYLIIQDSGGTLSNPVLELLEQESYWEIWLRRAGTNAYAAQAMIAELKEPEPRCKMGDEGYEREMQMIHEGGPYGLTQFVVMGLEERIRRLGGLVGRGVLERVSRVIDQIWE
ncbi:putative nucleoporin nup49 protein [Botrytis fragariae]|uniref:Putative nucleoporin nup49 protein n=1 Tax=Botrytis fragariae TaxID=1964551 RepID=A0A8H6AS20_9HELO|nr:putative nucleoporin nup49 protein [Botrytis fragariae]KAF5872449.1 putative nucleoporin nup49 protein [Botrytis fragariae]